LSASQTANKCESIGKDNGSMGKKKQKKKPINWQELAATALIDLIIGVIVTIIGKLLG
jgi:hypothetical protein